MKIAILSIVFLVASKMITYGQDQKQPKFCLYLGSGLIQHTTNDQLVNYFNYAGKALMPFSLSGTYFQNKNLFTLNLLYQTARLSPLDLPNNYYDFNYIQHRNFEISIEYFHEIVKVNEYVKAYIGINNSSYMTMQKENYKSLLFEYAEGYRKSSDISAITLFPMLLINYRIKKNNLSIKTGFSLLHYGARPDDNYVKQVGFPEGFYWRLYGPKNFKSFILSAIYQYEVFRGFGVTTGYSMHYRTFTLPDNYKYLQSSFLAGIFKSF